MPHNGSITLFDMQFKPQLCICLDPSNLNQTLARKPFYYGTPDDIFLKLAQTTRFTNVYLSKDYYHIELDEDISFLTAFNTPFSRVRFMRMQFGVTAAGDVFQCKLDTVIQLCIYVKTSHFEF